MLTEAKDASELMLDLAYASVYFGDPDMAEEVDELEDQMNDLVQDMRAVCILAVRKPKEAEAMASVLQVISAIERIANAAANIARIVTHRLGIPRELVADLSEAEEVAHRVLVRDGSHMANRPLAALELPVAIGSSSAASGRPARWEPSRMRTRWATSSASDRSATSSRGMPRRWVTMRAMPAAALAMRSMALITWSTEAMASASRGLRTARMQTARMSWTRSFIWSSSSSTSSAMSGSPKYTDA